MLLAPFLKKIAYCFGSGVVMGYTYCNGFVIDKGCGVPDGFRSPTTVYPRGCGIVTLELLSNQTNYTRPRIFHQGPERHCIVPP